MDIPEDEPIVTHMRVTNHFLGFYRLPAGVAAGSEGLTRAHHEQMIGEGIAHGAGALASLGLDNLTTCCEGVKGVRCEGEATLLYSVLLYRVRGVEVDSHVWCTTLCERHQVDLLPAREGDNAFRGGPLLNASRDQWAEDGAAHDGEPEFAVIASTPVNIALILLALVTANDPDNQAMLTLRHGKLHD